MRSIVSRSLSLLLAALAVGQIACAAPADETESAETASESLSSTSPVRISSDAELARIASAGSGTVSDPYVIANRKVAGHFSFATGADLDACFDIANTTKHFLLKDSSCAVAHAGVKLTNVQHATIRHVSLARIIGVFGWASPEGGGEDGKGIAIERSRHVLVDDVKISDVYGGFGTFGIPGGPALQDGRAGGGAFGVRVVGSHDVTLANTHVADMWGGAGGAGAVGLFAGDPASVGGRGGLGGVAVGIAFEGGGELVVSDSEIDGVRAGAGAAAAVSNLFFFGGSGGDAGDGNAALGITANGATAVTIRDSRVSELWGSAGGAGAIGGVGAVGGHGGRGGRGGVAAAIVVGKAKGVTLSGNTLSTMHGGAGGAGAAGVVGFVGGVGGSGGDGGKSLGALVSESETISVVSNHAGTLAGGAGGAGAAGAMGGSGAAGAGGAGGSGGWAVGFELDRSTRITITGNDVTTLWGAAGAMGGAGAIGAFFLEAPGGKGGDGGWAVGSVLARCEQAESTRNTSAARVAGTGGLGGGIELITMGAPGAPGESNDSLALR